MNILGKFMETKIAALVISISMVFLTGCSDEIYTQSSNDFSDSSNSVGTNGKLISIQSDNVLAAGYDANTMIMTVQFDNGAIYEYYSVPVNLWTDFYNAQPHPWSQVGYPRLVRGGFSYKRIQ